MVRTIGLKYSTLMREPLLALTILLALAFLWTPGCNLASKRAAWDRARFAPATGPTRRFDPADPQERFAASDPLGFLRMCRRHYIDNVSDYHCRFIKRERLRGVLTDEQEMEVLFRETPFSVDVRWVRNAGRAKRVSYVAGRWTKDGREFAMIYPAGLLGLLLPRGVKRDIHAPDVRAAARATIDRFGFKNTLDEIIKNCEAARGDPDYDLRYLGCGTLDDRSCLVFERRLPYTGPDGSYPSRLLVIHIDREWLVPTGCFAYADDEARELLGSYVSTNVEFNVGLSDEGF